MSFDREMPIVFVKLPLIVKILIGAVPILLLIAYVIVMNNKIKNNSEQFYRQGFSSIVLKSNTNSFTGRTTEFHLENGLKINFWLSSHNKISIGDSIQKNQNTYLYKVFRKGADGEYSYYATYDFQKME